MGWMVNATPRPRYPPGKTSHALYRRLGGPQGRSAWVRKISPPTRIRTPDHPARSESLYRLGYRGLFITQQNYAREEKNEELELKKVFGPESVIWSA
jgi:hypothetical protein